MANKTIYGCVNWATGQAVFEGEACDSGDYTGCVEWSGEHAGQVKVVISEEGCDDTYYGCVNWTTGKFQLVIPDDCCRADPPVTLRLTFSGVTECPPPYDWWNVNINGTWDVPKDDENEDYLWYKRDDDGEIYLYCVYIKATGKIQGDIHNSDDVNLAWIFNWNATDWGLQEANNLNADEEACGELGEDFVCGYGGIVRWIGLAY